MVTLCRGDLYESPGSHDAHCLRKRIAFLVCLRVELKTGSVFPRGALFSSLRLLSPFLLYLFFLPPSGVASLRFPPKRGFSMPPKTYAPRPLRTRYSPKPIEIPLPRYERLEHFFTLEYLSSGSRFGGIPSLLRSPKFPDRIPLHPRSNPPLHGRPLGKIEEIRFPLLCNPVCMEFSPVPLHGKPRPLPRSFPLSHRPPM